MIKIIRIRTIIYYFYEDNNFYILYKNLISDKMIIVFGKITWYLIFPVLAGLFYIERGIVYDKFTEYVQNKPTNFTLLVRLFLIELGNSLINILELVSIIRIRRKTGNSSVLIEVKKIVSKYKKKPKLILIIICLSICSSLGIIFSGYSFYYWNNKHKIFPTFLDLLARFICFILLSLLCHFFLKIQIHRHHYIGLGIFMIYFIIKCIISFSNQLPFDGVFSHYTVMMIIGTGLFDCLNVVYKYLIDFEYLSPYELAGLQALCSVIILLISNLILQNVDCDIESSLGFLCSSANTFSSFTESFRILFENKFIALILLFSGTIIGSASYTTFTQLTNKYLNPTYMIFFEMIYYCYRDYKDNEDQKIISICSLVFIVIGALIYSEIIVLKCFNLDYYTRYNIEKRSFKDTRMETIVDKFTGETILHEVVDEESSFY